MIRQMENEGIDIYDFQQVRKYFIFKNKINMVEYIDNYREAYTVSILKKEHEYVEFLFE
jgi:hypothetical protein